MFIPLSGAHVKVSGHLKVRWEFLAAQAQSITAFHPWRLNSESPRGVAVAFPGRRCKVVRSSGQVQCCSAGSAGSAGNAMGCNILCPSFSEQFDAPGANFCTEPMGYQPPKTVMSPDEPRRAQTRGCESLEIWKKKGLSNLANSYDLTCRLPSNTGVTLRSKAQNTGQKAKMRSSPVLKVVNVS